MILVAAKEDKTSMTRAEIIAPIKLHILVRVYEVMLDEYDVGR